MRKFTKVAVLLAVFAVLFCVFSCESEEKQEQVRVEKGIEFVKDDSIIRYNRLLSVLKNDTIKLNRTIDSFQKEFRAKYDSFGVDSLGRTMYVHKKDKRWLEKYPERQKPPPKNFMLLVKCNSADSAKYKKDCSKLSEEEIKYFNENYRF